MTEQPKRSLDETYATGTPESDALAAESRALMDARRTHGDAIAQPEPPVRAVPGSSRHAQEAGDRVEDGGMMGTLVRCEMCGGSGLLHQPDELPETVAPAPEPSEPADDEIAAEIDSAEEAAEAETRAYARGYAEAVARLRDDDRYRNWWTARPGAPGSYPVYWDGPGRSHLADYLETVGPDGIDVTTGIGVRSAGRALLEVLQFVALPFEANRAAYRLRHALGMSDVPDPVDGEETTAAAARRFAGELVRLEDGLRERGIVIAGYCPVNTAAVDTVLATLDWFESTVRMLQGALEQGWETASPQHAGESQASESAVAERLAATEPAAVIGVPPWLRGIIARHGEPAIDDTATSRAWLWDDHAVRITTTGSFGEVRAWTYDRRHAQLWLDRAPTDADVSAVIALAGLDDRWEIPPGAHGPVPPTATGGVAHSRLVCRHGRVVAECKCPVQPAGEVVVCPPGCDDQVNPEPPTGLSVSVAHSRLAIGEPVKRNAFDVAREALLTRYGTTDPTRLQTLGADSLEVDAAKQIVKREASR